MLRFMDLWHKDVIENSELITLCQNKLTDPLPTKHWKSHLNFNFGFEEMSICCITNFGITKAKYEKIFILDSDRILPTEYFNSVMNQLKFGIQITTSPTKKLKSEYSDSKIIDGDIDFFWDNRSTTNELGTKNAWSGNIALMKSDFINAGGMDELYVGYGWEDTDMTFTMEKYGIKSIYREETEIHLWHPPLTYGVKDQKKLFIENGLRLCKKWNKPLPQILRQDMLKYRNEEIL